MKKHLISLVTLRRVLPLIHIVVFVLIIIGLESCGGMNGEYIEPAKGPRGLCSLIVHNNYDNDIVVKLSEVKNPTVFLHYVYVASHSTAVITGIAPGSLMMKYSKGREWDKATKMFAHDRANFESDMVFKFEENETETKTNEGVMKEHHYSIQEFTLNASAGQGNTTSSPIDDSEFNGK